MLVLQLIEQLIVHILVQQTPVNNVHYLIYGLLRLTFVPLIRKLFSELQCTQAIIFNVTLYYNTCFANKSAGQVLTCDVKSSRT